MSNENNIELGFDLDALLNTGNKGAFRRRNKTEYLKAGTAFYRILPSFDQSDRRINFEYYMHWITGENGQKMKVQCTKGTEGYCPLCEAAKIQEEMVTRAKAQGKDSAQLKLMEEAVKSLRASRSIYFNAVNAAGEVVALELNMTTTKLLAKKMEQAKSLGFDPTHPKSGVWFRFTKNGQGRDAYEVDFKKIPVQVDGEVLEKNDRTALTDDLIGRLETSVTDLKNPENMYIQIFTSKELADFLRGVPLKSKFQKKTQSAADGGAEASAGETEQTHAAAPASNGGAQAGGTEALSNAAAEVARLRGLAKN